MLSHKLTNEIILNQFGGLKDDSLRKSTKHRQWDIQPSRFSVNTVNPIRRIVDVMKMAPNPDKEVIKLTIGDPTVYGLATAAVCSEAIAEAALNGKHDGYPNSIGSQEARQAVAEYSSLPTAPVTADDVIMTSGCSHALEMLFTLLANSGQNILIPRPAFSLYKCHGDSLGIETRYYDLLPDKEWKVDLKSLEAAIDENTTAVLLNSPSNPCGGVFSRQHMEDIVAICDYYKLPIISDEVYEHVVFNGKQHVSFAEVSTTVPVFAVSAISKRFLVPGWRLGWIILHNRSQAITPHMKSSLISLSQRIAGPCALIQGALPTILKKTPQSLFDRCNQLYEENALASYELLSVAKGLKPVLPSGAMYMMVGIDLESFPDFENDVQFTERLMEEESVFCLPATCFAYPGFFRVVLCMPMDKLTEACVRIQQFCARHYQQRLPLHLDANGDKVSQPQPLQDGRVLTRVSTTCYLKI